RSLGAGAVAAVAFLFRTAADSLRRIWEAHRRPFRLRLRWPRRQVWGVAAGAILVALAVAGLGSGEGRWTGGAVLALAAGGTLAAGLAAASLVQLGGFAWPALGLVPLGTAAAALAWRAAGIAAADPSAAWPSALVLTVAALSLSLGLFAADYWQTVRLNLLLEARPPVFPVKLASCLAGLSGAFFAASNLVAAASFQPAAEAGLAGRAMLAALAGRLPSGLVLSGAALGAFVWLSGRPVWPLALGASLPLPWAFTLLAGAEIGRLWPKGARTTGLGLLLGDLAVQGICLLLGAWGMMQKELQWGEVAQPVGTGGGCIALGTLAAVAGLAVWLSWAAERRGRAEGLQGRVELPAGNTVTSG
ncbi:MAG TPA: hypothetical protein GXX28_06725, partial [Firmicutes bacterium]|nr:hypothetical protein [Bacillota bacterium]